MNLPLTFNRLLIVFMLFNMNYCLAENNSAVDSLLNVLQKSAGDTSRIKTLRALSKHYLFNGEYTKGRQYSAELLTLSTKLNNDPGIFWSYTYLGMIDEYEGNYDDALNNFLIAEKIAKKTGDKILISVNQKSLGNIYFIKGDPIKALDRYSQSLTLAREINDKVSIASVLLNIGNIYYDQGGYSDATANYLDALELFESVNDKQSISTCYFNIAQTYLMLANYEESIKYNFMALDLRKEIGNKSGIASCYNNIGTYYFEMGNYEVALAHFDSSLQIRETLGEEMNVIQTYYNIASIYDRQKKHKEAEQLFNQVLEIAKKNESNVAIAYGHLGLTQSYFNQGDYKNASHHANLGLINATDAKTVDLMTDFYEQLSKIDSANGNYKGAYLNYKKFQFYNDSLFSQEKENKINRLTMKYEFSKKEDSLNHAQELTMARLKQQELMTSKQRTAKNFLIAGIVLIGVLSFFVYKNYRTRQKLKLQTLRNKIASDLHDDVGSTLSSISIFSQIAREQSKEVIPMLDTIGESSRKMLDAMADIVWTINPDNDQFEKIIMRMRTFAFDLLGAKHIDFEFSADDVSKIKLPMETRKNLYLIFKEATNNLVKYAEANKAMFAIKKENESLTMLIRDNGKGFNSTAIQIGNGLKNMKRRANEIGAQLMIDSSPGNGTTIKLSLEI